MIPNEWPLITSLNREHDRGAFDCGETELNEYLKHYAMQNQKSGFARTFVAISKDTPRKIRGYYSITASSIDKTHLPDKTVKRFPNYHTPIVRLARLAVDLGYQKKGLGEHLLMDALHRSLEVSHNIGCLAIIVDSKHNKAKRFYEKYEFESLPNNPLTLWLPMQSVSKLFEKK